MTDFPAIFPQYGNVTHQPPSIRLNETSLAQSLEDWIQKLRAYAAIATGSKRAGDAALALVINQLIDEHCGLCGEPGFDYRTFLFKLLEGEVRNNDSGEQMLRCKAFVLIEIEGLSVTQTAQILGVRTSEIERWWIDPEYPSRPIK